MIDWTRWPNFSEAEMRCKGSDCCGGRANMDPGFMDSLQTLRSALGFPLPITSAYRCPDHNDKVSSTGRNGPHTTGMAVDIHISGEHAFDLVGQSYTFGFTGFGFKQHGPWDKRFVHIDTIQDLAKRPRVWTYT